VGTWALRVRIQGAPPDEDATVVERVLDAGAIILGKAVCESLCFSGAARATPPAGLRAHGCRR
jgi:amidase